MSIRKTKAKKKASLKAKAKKQTKVKAKTKPKAPKTKTKPKAKTKSKAKSKTKLRVKPKTKAKQKPKVKSKPKVSAKQKAKTKAVSNMTKFTDDEKYELLLIIEKIIQLHKGLKGGLKSFTGVDLILNKYNQRFTTPTEKFDAIAAFGMEKDPRVVHKNFYVNVEGREKDVDELYILLSRIAKGKINFHTAHEAMETIYAKDLEIFK
jgi:hypothetical protein